MTDIIANAKRLLEGATPGPWRIDDSIDPEYPELQGAPVSENGLVRVPVLFDNICGYVSLEDAELIAAAPELAKAVIEQAEEIERLQQAVREMLYELNVYQQQENDQRVRKEALDTIETYGLTEEDMK